MDFLTYGFMVFSNSDCDKKFAKFAVIYIKFILMKTCLCVVDGSTTTRNNVVSPSDGNGNQECPVCNVAGFQNQNQLAEHIDSHFNEKKNTVNNFALIFVPFDYILDSV